jgi:hypothetical protein
LAAQFDDPAQVGGAPDVATPERGASVRPPWAAEPLRAVPDQPNQPQRGPRDEPRRRDEPFGHPYGQPQPPPGPGATGPDPGESQRAASRQAGTRSRRGRPEDPRQAAVYDALAINEQVLDEVWTSPSVDVLKVVSSIVVNALDAYEDDPAEYADWVAVHRTGNCDCH